MRFTTGFSRTSMTTAPELLRTATSANNSVAYKSFNAWSAEAWVQSCPVRKRMYDRTVSPSSRCVPTTVMDLISSNAAGAVGAAAGAGGVACANAGVIVPDAARAVEPIKKMPTLLRLPKGLLFIVIRSDVRAPPGVGLLPLKRFCVPAPCSVRNQVCNAFSRFQKARKTQGH